MPFSESCFLVSLWNTKGMSDMLGISTNVFTGQWKISETKRAVGEMWKIVFSYQIYLKAWTIYKRALWEGIKKKREKKKEENIDDAEDWTQDPLTKHGIIHGLNRTTTKTLFSDTAHLKLCIFKYEQNNNRLLEIYKNTNKLTLINCKNMTLCIFLIVIYR